MVGASDEERIGDLHQHPALQCCSTLCLNKESINLLCQNARRQGVLAFLVILYNNHNL